MIFARSFTLLGLVPFVSHAFLMPPATRAPYPTPISTNVPTPSIARVSAINELIPTWLEW